MQDSDKTVETLKRRGKKEGRRDGLLTTGDMARLSNNTLRTVRFYEEENILHPVQRSEGGHRLFAPVELDRLMLVTDMRAAGLSLDEIKVILHLRRSSKTSMEASREACDLLAAQTESMRKRISVLQRLQQDFELASQIFSGCKHCENEQASPSNCRLCGVSEKPSVLPRAVRVLWNVDDQD